LRRNREFMLLQAGQLLSATGSQVTSIAYPLLVLALTNSAVRAGIVAFARAIPAGLLAIPAGLAADRWNRKAVMIGADIVRLLAVGLLASAVFVHHAAFWLIVVAAFVEGCGSAFFAAASPAAIRAVVPHEQLPDALGANTGRQSAVMLAGPPLGGALFGVSRVLPFFTDAGSYVFSFVSLLLIRTPFQSERQADTAPLGQQVKEGMTFIWSQPFIRASSFLYGLLNFTAPGLLFCVVVIGKEEGRSSAAVGGLVAIFAVSALVGSFFTGRVRRVMREHSILVLEMWGWTACAAFLVWPNAYVLGASLAPVGLVVASSDSIVHAYRLAITPDRLLGRSESVRSAMAMLLGSLSPLVAGLLIADTTPRWTIAFFTVMGVGLVLWGMASKALRSVAPLDQVDRLP
jgi:MFS family permease